ncbi:MAG: hypothetical protein ACI9TK_000737 [Flavobacteriaceae bacterium]|jgi:hypothetical protein
MLTKINIFSPIFLSLFFFIASAQETYTPKKAGKDQIIIDGLMNPEEWSNATPIEIDIEVKPGNNLEAGIKTIGYITYTDTHLFLAFHAFDDPKNIRASIRSRDDFGIISDDFVTLRLDTYADGRNNYLLLSNAFGSQLDARAINALTDEDRYDSSFNIDYQSVGSIVNDGYQVEFKIPFSSIPFPNGKDQLWHFNLFRKYYRNGNEIEVRSQSFDRDNPCEVCQTKDRLILNDIVFKSVSYIVSLGFFCSSKLIKINGSGFILENAFSALKPLSVLFGNF